MQAFQLRPLYIYICSPPEFESAKGLLGIFEGPVWEMSLFGAVSLGLCSSTRMGQKLKTHSQKHLSALGAQQAYWVGECDLAQRYLKSILRWGVHSVHWYHTPCGFRNICGFVGQETARLTKWVDLEEMWSRQRVCRVLF